MATETLKGRRSSSPARAAASAWPSRCAPRATAPTSPSPPRPPSRIPSCRARSTRRPRRSRRPAARRSPASSTSATRTQIAAAVAKTVETFGGIDILVNNASAISLTGTVVDADEALRPDALGQHARHLRLLAGVHPAPQEGDEPAHPQQLAAAQHGRALVRAARRLHDGEVRHERVRARHGRGAQGRRHRRQRALAAHGHRHRGGAEPPRRRRGDAAARARPRSWPTRPTPSSPSRAASSPATSASTTRCCKKEGVTDFDKYASPPGADLIPDFFL